MSETEPPRLSILLVEDNPGDRRLAEIALREAGAEAHLECELAMAESLAEGIARLSAPGGAFDAVLLDLGLPDAKGLDGLKALRSARPDVAIVVLTGLSDLAIATEALRFGAGDYLDKGEVEPRPLLRAIRYAIERKKSESELVRLARTDPLTGLLNRRAFFEELEQAVSQARRSELACAVVLFDIDRFKEINDLFGHQAGDDLLVAVARNLERQLRESDAVARIGGDEFAVVATNLRSAGAAMEVAEKVAASVRAVGTSLGPNYDTSVSVGISVFPMDDSAADLLVSHADMAMYKSKTSRRGTVNFFDAHMDADVKLRHALKRRMAEDIAAGRFLLHFQPIVDAATHRVVAAEGLARWFDDEGRLISPAVFIPIAEESASISLLGARLLEEACAYLHEWRERGLAAVPVSLNISPIQCRDPSFGARLVATIQDAGIPTELINIEITESTIIKNLEVTQKNLELLKSFGVGIHIDDFGTGYSSLSVLRDLPLDVLKIDRSFVADIGRRAGAESIVQAVVELARKLKFRTIAEGVERGEQAAILAEIGVDFLQGFRFSRPVEARQFADSLAQSRAERVA
jgi:diguanylate cyclase (GGDEF)-like protein